MSTDKNEQLKIEINEVKLLLEGIVSYGDIPAPILDLAIAKTDRLKALLAELKNGEKQSSVSIPEAVVDVVPKAEPKEEVKPVEQPEPIVEILPKEEEPVETEMEKPEVVISEPEIVPEVEEEEPIKEEPVAIEKPEPVEEKPHKKPLFPKIEDVKFDEEEEKETKVEPATEVVEKTEKKEISTERKATVADRLAADKTAVNERFESQKGTVGQRVVTRPIDNIKKAIPINDRFRFQRDLFSNNVQEFNRALDHLETLASLDEAQKYITSQFSWDVESSTTNDFMALVERRFIR